MTKRVRKRSQDSRHSVPTEGGVTAAEFQSTVKGDVVCQGTHRCFTVVFQREGEISRRKGSRGVRRKRGETTSVVWHAVPGMMQDHKFIMDSIDERPPPQSMVKMKRAFLNKLKSGEKITIENTFLLHPLQQVMLVLDYLDGIPGGKIKATVIPGKKTIVSGDAAAQDTLDAVREVLARLKSAGRIHKVETRGLSKDAETSGVLRIHVLKGAGRIYRDTKAGPAGGVES